MRETAVVLREGTPMSLVLLDELGRGTGTGDGAALAGAVLGSLAEAGPRTLFSTHFHALDRAFEGHKAVSHQHMVTVEAV